MSSTTFFTFAPCSVVVLLSMLSAVWAADIEVGVKKRILPIPNSVTLTCSGLDNSMESTDFKIKRELNGQTTIFTDYTASIESTDQESDRIGTATFSLTPDLEGYYSCEVDLVTSSNDPIPLVAYPEPDIDIMAITTYTAMLTDDSPPIRCEFPPGALSDAYYTVQWSRGTETLATWGGGDAPSNSKYQVSDDFSLVVSDVTAADASDAYYCTVFVDDGFDTVATNIGVHYELVVMGDLTVTRGLSNGIPRVNEVETFSCTAAGVPEIASEWLVDGAPLGKLPADRSHRYVTRQQQNFTDGVFLQSTELTITQVSTMDTSRIQCLFHNSKGPGTQFASSSAFLIVLGAPSEPVLEAKGSTITLSVALAGLIPTGFSLSIRYLHSVTDTMTTTIVSDPSFSKTSAITNFPIPSKDLPPFSSFVISVAVEVDGVMGPYSMYSMPTTYMLEDITPCSTLSQSTSPAATNAGCISLSTLLAVVFVILFVMATAILLLTIFFIFCSKYRYKQQMRDDSRPVVWRQTSSDHPVDLPYMRSSFAMESSEFAQSDVVSPAQVAMVHTALDQSPGRLLRHHSMETPVTTYGFVPRQPSERQPSPGGQYETIAAVASPSHHSAYVSTVPSNGGRKRSIPDTPAAPSLPTLPEVGSLPGPSSSVPVLPSLDDELRRGVAINPKEKPVMVDAGTSASPPSSSMPDLPSSLKESFLDKEFLKGSPRALQKTRGARDGESRRESLSTAPSTPSSRTAPTPPIMRSFKSITNSTGNSPSNAKHRCSQEELKKEDIDDLTKDYEIIGTPPDEALAK